MKSITSVVLLILIFEASVLAAFTVDEVDEAVADAQLQLNKDQRKYTESNDFYEFNFYYTNLLQEISKRPANIAFGSNAIYLRALKKATLDLQIYSSMRQKLIAHLNQKIKAIDRIVLNKNVSDSLRQKLIQARMQLLNARDNEDNAGKIRGIKDYEYFNPIEIDKSLVEIANSNVSIGRNDVPPAENDYSPGKNDYSPGKNDDPPGENYDPPGEDDDSTGNNDDSNLENDDSIGGYVVKPPEIQPPPSLTAKQIVRILKKDPVQLRRLSNMVKNAFADDMDKPEEADDYTLYSWQ